MPYYAKKARTLETGIRLTLIKRFKHEYKRNWFLKHNRGWEELRASHKSIKYADKHSCWYHNKCLIAATRDVTNQTTLHYLWEGGHDGTLGSS